jgi:hypothetical protein
MGLLDLDVPLLKPPTSAVLGLCQEAKKADQGGSQADQGEDQGNNMPGNSENAPGQNKGGDAPFPAPAV